MASPGSYVNMHTQPISRRKLGRWYLSEILGKGGYSWVKKGYDRKTGQPVALKFMDKRKMNDQYHKQQIAQVNTEIDALKNIHHPNVVKLLAYNMNTTYPDKSGITRYVILLVLEYMSGGELFDILYYTKPLNDQLGRTYFRQLIAGVEACHKAGVCHRDIKPQNLLLDSHYRLKLTDFGLSKIFKEGMMTKTMTTHNVGTRGYQAPELFQKGKYTMSCDIFSCGVVLFILLAGYPPFEHARIDDKWYSPMVTDDVRKFWKHHKGCNISPEAKDLISKMISYKPPNRITLKEIKKHPWYLGKILSDDNLAETIETRHKLMEMKRDSDPKKRELLDTSCGIPRGIHAGGLDLSKDIDCNESPQAPAWPDYETLGISTTFTKIHGFKVLFQMKAFIESKMNGSTHLNEGDFTMDISVATLRNAVIKLTARIYYHEEFNCNIVKIQRIQGEFFLYRTVLNKILDGCYSVFTGVKETDLMVSSSPQNKLDQIFQDIQDPDSDSWNEDDCKEDIEYNQT